MRKRMLVVLVLAVCGLVAGAAFAEEGWLDDLDAAVKQAAEQKKLVLVDFTASWCGWCTKMKEDVFDKDEFKALAGEKFVLVTIDGDKHRDLVDKFGVQGFPTLVILDGEGKEVHKIVGYKPLTPLLEELKKLEPAK
ncbi:MAG: Thioredoxin Disulfide Isomerase [Candidatus Ozemobacter sibiricus]|jgi:thioredoxin-related protein|uniref:Thioredoxin Disulfide Isomerase n=1 Tax=Candidatus Ozemobacter sibiricus TaxID=2268124 RepID=A0A367ZQ79_9BACT|nr:MAG: Thioredoxin Disulfide Isomerase [Candidatus Ozemobacter sibiricus]